jgi:hypothetical protein
MDPLQADTFTRSRKPSDTKATAYGREGPPLAKDKQEPFTIWTDHKLAADGEITALLDMLGRLANGMSVAQVVARCQKMHVEAGRGSSSLRPRLADPEAEKIAQLLVNRERTSTDCSTVRELMERHLQLRSQRLSRYQASTPKLTTAEELRSCSGAAELKAPNSWTRERSASR